MTKPLPQHRPVRIRLAVALALATAACACLIPASRALAGPTQLTIMQDDTQLVYGSPSRRLKRLHELKALGVDIVKVRVSWSYIAPSTNSRRKPRRFDATNPSAYSARRWGPFDDLVRQATALGLRVYAELGGSAPRWASAGGRRGSNVTRPNAGEFAKFVKAVGQRYSGSFSGLPRVSLWAVWNEPNLVSWLAPQYHGKVPVSPGIYRSLIYAADAGLRASGHGGDQLLFGELLPFARSGKTGGIKVRPIDFLRELACVDSHYRPYGGRAAAQRGCQHFRPLPGTGVSYHPYTLAGGPNVSTPNPSDASIANLSRVTRALDELGRRGRLQTPRMLLWLSEFGFQTNPPDTFQTPIRRVPGFMGESEWLAFHDPRVVSYSQYPLVDDPSNGGRGFSGFHSGLRFHNGRPKPGVYAAFKTPFFPHWISGSTVEIFGGVRGAAPGTSVTVEASAGKGKHFSTIGTLTIGAHGYFDHYFNLSGARNRKYRFRAGRYTSRTAPPA